MNNDIDRLVERTLAYGRRGQQAIRESLRRERVVWGVADLMVDCSRELTDKWEHEGFRVQGFSFQEGDAEGNCFKSVCTTTQKDGGLCESLVGRIWLFA